MLDDGEEESLNHQGQLDHGQVQALNDQRQFTMGIATEGVALASDGGGGSSQGIETPSQEDEPSGEEEEAEDDDLDHAEEAKGEPLAVSSQRKHTLQATLNLGIGPIIDPDNVLKPKQGNKGRTRQKNGQLKKQLWTRVLEVNGD